MLTECNCRALFVPQDNIFNNGVDAWMEVNAIINYMLCPIYDHPLNYVLRINMHLVGMICVNLWLDVICLNKCVRIYIFGVSLFRIELLLQTLDLTSRVNEQKEIKATGNGIVSESNTDVPGIMLLL